MPLSIGQIKKYLKQLQASRDQYIYYLGTQAYQALKDETLSKDTLAETCTALDGIHTQIAEWEQNLVQAEAEKAQAKRPTCPYCGANVVKGAAFCPVCGNSLFPAQEQACAPASAMAAGTCPTCGCVLTADAAFCPKCGAAVQPPAVVASATALQAPVAAAPRAPAPPASEVAAPEVPVAPPVAPAAADAAAQVTCQDCGSVYEDLSIAFCPNCGSKIF